MLVVASKFVSAAIIIGFATCASIAPEPAIIEQVAFMNAGETIAGEIHFPTSKGRVPGVVLVHGSGAVTREGNAPLIEPFLSRGIAVLVYDKRGTGRSGGAYRGVGPINSDSMIRLLAGDAVSALHLMAAHARIDATRLGLAGGSQAGWIIPNAAARYPVRFAVILSGPLVSVGEENFYSRYFEGTTFPLEKTDSVMALFSGVRGYEPIADLRQVRGAVYWAHGAMDRSIPAVMSAMLANDLIATLGRSDWHAELLPSGDHSLFDANTHRQLEVFPSIQRWLTERLR
ncbi:MAG: prolyl oligopeptidase family serine peptidase [Gemmatimonadaceae bacterium]